MKKTKFYLIQKRENIIKRNHHYKVQLKLSCPEANGQIGENRVKYA